MTCEDLGKGLPRVGEAAGAKVLERKGLGGLEEREELAG